MNQSTVFRRIEQLEHQLGARLFDRDIRGYSLTAVGEAMLSHALRIEDDALALDRAIAGADAQVGGVVSLATVDEVLECIAPHLHALHAKHPKLHLEINTGLRLASLTRREADVAIRPGLRPTEPDVVGRPLVRLAMAAYASVDYLRERTPPQSLDALDGHALIAFSNRDGSPFGFAPAIGQVVCRANSMAAQLSLTRAGLGIGFLPTFLAGHHRDLTQLFALPAPADYSLWLLIHADLRQTARVRVFVDFMSEAIRNDRARYESANHGV